MFISSATLDNTSTTEATHARTLQSISISIITLSVIVAEFYAYVAYSEQDWQMAPVSHRPFHR